jgi:alpha-1,2-glucosyltransferase
LPLQVFAGLRRFAVAVRARPWLLVAPLAGLALYALGFHADNPYNAALPAHLPRNALLLELDADPAWRLGAGLAMMLAACGLGSVALRPRGAALLYPFAALFLAASWLIEQRYAIVPLVLWLAFREQRGRAQEYATLALWLVFAVCVMAGVLSGRYFI